MAPNPLRRLARTVPAPLDAFAELGAAGIDDLIAAARVIDRGLPGDSIDEWDPEHIRRTLPLNRTFVRSYFRAEVTAMENIPEGP